MFQATATPQTDYRPTERTAPARGWFQDELRTILSQGNKFQEITSDGNSAEIEAIFYPVRISLLGHIRHNRRHVTATISRPDGWPSLQDVKWVKDSIAAHFRQAVIVYPRESGKKRQKERTVTLLYCLDGALVPEFKL